MEVYVIRHTPVDVPKGICYGQTNVNLLANYRNDVALFSSKVPPQLDAVFSSPLHRCTLIAALFSSQFLTDDRLMEMNFGEWEMQQWSDIPKSELDPWMQDWVTSCPPGGENFQVVYNRVVSFLEHLRNQEYSKVLLVTHAGVFRCLWTYLLQIPLANAFKIPINYGEVFHFHLGPIPFDDFIISKK